MSGFDFEKLDVYAASLDFVVVARALRQRLPPGNGDLADQLTRAASSIVLNIAEGTGAFRGDDKAHKYRSARGSAFACAAVLDIMTKLDLADATEVRNGRELLERIGAMLTQLAESVQTRNPGARTGSSTRKRLPGSGSRSGSGSE